MKQLLCILCVWASLSIPAQPRTYSSDSLYNILQGRIHRMETMIYKAAIQGKVKAYKTDSLRSSFTPDALEEFVKIPVPVNNYSTGIYMKAMDSVPMKDFGPEVDCRGLCGFYSARSSLSGPEQKYRLRSVALMYEPFAGNTTYRLPVQPMIFIKYKDLKALLPESEFRLLVTLCALSLSDQEYGSAHALDSLNLKIRKEQYYGPGIYNEYKKYAFIHPENVKAISQGIYNYTVYVMHEEGLSRFHLQQKKKRKPADHTSQDLLTRALTDSVTITLYAKENDSIVKKDTIIRVLVSEEAFTALEVQEDTIGMRRDNPEHTPLYFTRKEFRAFAPKWLSVFLFEVL